MKFLKKAISMVLVFAMLASFAGMTGFTPSIIARAASNIVVQAPSTIYKAYGYAYEYSSGGVKYTSPTTDAVIPLGSDCSLNSNIGMVVTFPEGTEYFHGELSVDGEKYYGIWGSVSNDSFPYGTNAAQISRPTPQTSDYLPCDLYNGNLKGKGGYSDFDTVYWRFRAYTSKANADAKNYFDEIVVPIKLEFAPVTESSGAKINYSTPPTSDASSKPLDSLSGINALTQFDVPSVLYANGSLTNTDGTPNTSSVIVDNLSDVSSTDSGALDTTVNIKFPTGTTSAKFHVISFEYDSTNKNDKILKTFDVAIGSDMTGSVNLQNQNVSALEGHAGYMVYRLDYTVSVNHADAAGNKYSDMTSVTYMQYAASYVVHMPDYKSGMQSEYINNRSSWGQEPSQSIAVSEIMNYKNILTLNGINLYSSYKSQTNSIPSTTANPAWFAGTGLTSANRTGLGNEAGNNAIVFFNWYRENKGEDKWYVITNNNTDDCDAYSNTTVGTTIYYDQDLRKDTATFNFLVDFYTSFDGKKNKSTSLKEYWGGWGTLNSNLYEYYKHSNGAYGFEPVENGVAADYNRTRGGNVNDFNNGNTVAGITGSSPSGVTGVDIYTGNWDTNYTIDFNNAAFDAETHYVFTRYLATETTKSGTTKANIRAGAGFHLDVVPRDRSESRTLKNNAITYNYVKVEMDDTWWQNYRNNVLYAYYNLGNLTSAGNPLGITNSYQEYPVYRGIDYNTLFNEIYGTDVTPMYERGSANDNSETSWYKKGSQYAAKIDYKGTYATDASHASYSSSDHGGNGINNLTVASLYRYSGAYFYTPAKWETYATLRYESVGLLNYPVSVAFPLNFNYGHSQVNSTGVANWEHPTFGWFGGGLACYKQAEIDEMVIQLRAARQVLDSGYSYATLAEFKMRNDKNPSEDYDGDGVADNVTAGNGAWMKDANGNQIIGYDAIMAYLASLIPTDTYTYYTTVSDANGNGKIDALDLDGDGYIDDLNPRTAQVYDTTQLEALFSHMQSKFHADDTVVDMGLEFEAYIENFLALVEITLRNPQNANNDAWTQIFTYLNGTSVAGDLRPSTGLKAVNFVDEISKIYTLTDAQKNNFQSLIDTYNTAAAPDPNTYVTTRDALSQGSINTAIGNFFAALLNAFPSIQVALGGQNAKDTAKDPTAVFTIYAPSKSENFTESIYTSDSISKLETEVAKAMDLNSYTFALTTWQSLVDRKNEIEGWATVFNPTTNPTGLLKNSYVNITELETALAYAKNFRDTDSTISVTSPDGKQTVTHNYYSAQSVAELNVVINEAQSVYDTNKANPAIYTNQLAVDKLTFALYEESNDAKLNLIKGNPGEAYRSWTYDAATDTATYEENWDDEWFTSKLYGVRDNAGSAEGLKPNTAYYEFLITELSTPYTSNGVTVDGGKLWDSETGWVIVGSDGKVPVDSGIFNETWGEYVSACNAALDLYNAYKAGKPLTADSQKTITDAAKAVYEKRNALQFATYNFDKDEMYETVKGYYATLSAYVQKTDITRYGYEYAEVTNEVTDETTGEVTTVTTTVFQESADPLSSVKQSVYIYTNVTPELEAALTEFYAKYASDAPTAKAGTWLTEGGGKELYDRIVAMTKDCAAKKTNDETLTAGMKDLTENYIAGDWDGTTYTSTLLNQTQIEALNGKDGVEGLLPAAQKLITPLNSEGVAEAVDATAEFGGKLANRTDDIFNYTKNPATNLQFATYMRDNELFAFLDYEYTNDNPDYGVLVSYYYQDGLYTYRLISENIANEIKKQVNDYFAVADNWPSIYEVNGVTWNKEEVTAPDAYSDAVVDGYLDYNADTYESWGGYKGDNEKICKILDRVASRAHNYSDALTRGLMPVKSEHYTWLVDNAITNIGGIDYVLADASAVSATDEAPFNYDVSVNNINSTTEQKGWYTAGYGIKDVADGKYYLYYDSKNVTTPSWFEEVSRSELEEALSLSKFADKEIGYARDEDYNLTEKITSMENLKTYTPSDYFTLDNPGLTLADLAETSQKMFENWSYYPGYNDLMFYVSQSTETVQGAIDEITNGAYSALHDLILLPATEAYRDVYNTYLSVMGQHIADGAWSGDSFSTGDTSDLMDDEGNQYYKFYNLSTDFIKTLDSSLINATAGADKMPPYGTAVSSSNLWGSYDQTSDAYIGMLEFINTFKDNTDLITIDKAALVNGYKNDTAKDTEMEKLVNNYLSKLVKKANDFTLLNTVIQAFLRGTLQTEIIAEESMMTALGLKNATITSEYGTYYPTSNSDEKSPLYYYKEKSLLSIIEYLKQENTNVLANTGQIYTYQNNELVFAPDFNFSKTFIYDGANQNSTFYSPATSQETIDDVLRTLANKLANDLEFNPVDTDGLVEEIARGDAVVPEKYDQNHDAWGEYIDALKDAKDLRDDAGNYDIRFQESVIDAMESRLAAAINALEEAILADDYAPSMTLKTSVSAVEEFYGKEAYEVALRQAEEELARLTATGEGNGATYTANPTAGTFFVPNSSGYSLIVYTNELDPRIVINLEDLEQNLAGEGSTAVWQDAAKSEYISIDAVKTSGVTANVIAGTIVPAHNNEAESLKVEKAMAATATQAVQVTNSSDVKGSSAFAILAPRFVEGKATQAAVYRIEARDGSQRTVDTGTVYGNPANKFDFGGAGQEPVDIEVLDSNNKIAIYVYYYSLKAADGKDEGISANGTALATPAISGTHVPSALLSGEPGFNGTDWRNGILLQRHFSDSHRVWEYVSEIKQNEQKQYSVNGTQVPLYNDPNFDQLNTGSFYYVLDRNAAENTVDRNVIDAYKTAKNSNVGCMDYDAATTAKTAMINAIKAMSEDDLKALKSSDRFYNYGDYYTDSNGKVLTYDNGEPQWVNWAQSLNNKVENGDLVFVHVVDRWGNVVNRIVEITNLDKSGPQVSSDEAGKVTINEDGGSGITDIQVHNGDFSLGKFDYEISQNQNVELKNGEVANNAVVNCASNVLTIVNLVPGKTYYIGAEDNAGNRGTTAVKADANGHIVITIINEIVQTGEDMGFDSTSIFTLNGTDTIILNSGEASSVIDASLEGNVFANRTIRHYVTTKDTVTALKTIYQDGTVEEFTAETVTVKDNGDGTHKWLIPRKLAEGEHTYKVYAKVDGEYETFYAPATITATNRTIRFTYTIAGMGRTVLKYSGSNEIKNSTMDSREIPYGAKVTITAEQTSTDSDFYYWMNGQNERIISTSNAYEFTAVTNTSLTAQFTSYESLYEGKKLVIYVNNAKNVIKAFELADGESYTVPTGPVLPDYTFKGWSMTKAEVLASDKDTVIVEPIYELNASNTVTITEGNYTATGAGTYTAEDNQRAVVTISTSAKDGDGKEFLYWIDADTDEIVSYDRTYSFFCVKDTELTPVYGDKSAITAEPIVRITEVKFNALSGKVSFFAERSVPEEFMILQTGIVVTKTESIGTNEEVFVVGGTSTAAGTSTSTANNGYYSANIAVATGQTVWARAYVIYETADGEIFEAYGPVVSYTVD